MTGMRSTPTDRLRAMSLDLEDRSISRREALELVELIEAAAGAVILTYDPAKTTEQNDLYQRKAARLDAALAPFGFGPRTHQ